MVIEFDGLMRIDVPVLMFDVVERIGAGDAFVGGYLMGVLIGKGAVECIRLGYLCVAGVFIGYGDIAVVLLAGIFDELVVIGDAQWLTLDYLRVSVLSTGARR